MPGRMAEKGLQHHRHRREHWTRRVEVGVEYAPRCAGRACSGESDLVRRQFRSVAVVLHGPPDAEILCSSRVLPRLVIRPVVVVGVGGGGRPRRDAEFGEDVADVGGHCLLADEQFLCDHSVRLASRRAGRGPRSRLVRPSGGDAAGWAIVPGSRVAPRDSSTERAVFVSIAAASWSPSAVHTSARGAGCVPLHRARRERGTRGARPWSTSAALALSSAKSTAPRARYVGAEVWRSQFHRRAHGARRRPCGRRGVACASTIST